MKTRKIELMGCSIDGLTMNETIRLVEDIIREGKPRQHVVVNALKFAMMRRDPELKSIINECDVVNADGMPVVWASRILGNPLPDRVAGVDLFMRLVEIAARKGYRPYFFGAREPVLQKTLASFRAMYPMLKIAGYRNGYFSTDEEEGIASQIRDSRADMLFVGISSPLKEKFLKRWMPCMQVPFCMGVGGSFDIVAGLTKRAPLWMQRFGIEWLHRIIQEPRRMWMRYAKTNPVFIWMVLESYLRLQMRWQPNKITANVKQ